MHPPLPLAKPWFLWTVSAGFEGDGLLKLAASGSEEQHPPEVDEVLSHVTTSLSISAGVFSAAAKPPVVTFIGSFQWPNFLFIYICSTGDCHQSPGGFKFSLFAAWPVVKETTK